jgi:hypothetical protein
MALYVISYDQHRDKDYTPIWNYLDKLGAVRVLESLWILESNSSASDLRNALRTATNDEDSIFVIQVFTNSGWAAYNIRPEGSGWLTRYIP